MLSQVDKCQAELLQSLNERVDKPKIELALKEAQDFVKSKPTEIELIQQQLVKVRQAEQDLRERLFNNKLIDFEPCSMDQDPNWRNQVQFTESKLNRDYNGNEGLQISKIQRRKARQCVFYFKRCSSPTTER